MNKLDRFRYGDLHKRRIVFVIVLVGIIFSVSLLLLSLLGVFGARSELPRIRISADVTAGRTEGVGINVLDIPDANLISDPFFSNQDICLSAQVKEASGNYIYFNPEDAAVFSDIQTGSVNVLNIDADGNMGIRYSGNVMGFDYTRFSNPVFMGDSNAYWLNDPVVKTLNNQGILYFLTQEGKIIANASVSPELVPIEEVVSDICIDGINIYAVTTNGNIYVSVDNSSFELMVELFLPTEITANFISVIGGTTDVFLSDGTVYTIGNQTLSFTADINADFVVSGHGFTVIAEGNRVYTTRNNIFVNELTDVQDYMVEGDRITDVKAFSDVFYILTGYGRILKVEMDHGGTVTSCDVSSIEPISICPCGIDSVLAVTSDKQAYYISFSDSYVDSLGYSSIATEELLSYDDSRFIIKSGNNLYVSYLLSALEVDTPIADETILEGDICQFKYSTVDVDSWQTVGNTDMISQFAGVSVIGTGEEQHAVSRILPGATSALFERNLFYRIEVNMSSSVDGLPVSIWLEGQTFGSVGMNNYEVPDRDVTLSYVFAVTESMLSDESIRLNIAFSGDAVVNINSIYVGLDRYDINTVQPEFIETIASSSPSALRFENMNPGINGFSNDVYYGVSSDSLESALQLSKNSNANPWIVFGPSITQSDVDNFLGYLCGSVSNEYGKRRIDNGTALPWNRQFDTIYLEICDSEGMFPTDFQKGAYVAYVMGLFAKSPFYIDIKDSIVFVDGMEYTGGVMLSNADRHASSVVITPDTVELEDGTIAALPFAQCAYNAFEAARYGVPRSASRGGTDGGEFICSLSFDFDSVDYDAADIVSAIINSESEFSDLIMVDSDTDIGQIISTLRPLMGGSIMYCETMDPVDSNSAQTAEAFNEACDTILIDGVNSIYLIVSNHSDSFQQFMTQSDAYDTSVGTYSRYSADGHLLIQRDLNYLGLRQILQPGEYMIIEIPK